MFLSEGVLNAPLSASMLVYLEAPKSVNSTSPVIPNLRPLQIVEFVIGKQRVVVPDRMADCAIAFLGVAKHFQAALGGGA